MSFSLTLFPAPGQATAGSEERMGSHLGRCREERGEGGSGASTICGWGWEGQMLGFGKERLKKRALGFPDVWVVKNPPAKAGDGNPLQYSCLENSMDRGIWQATVLGVTKSQTQLSD